MMDLVEISSPIYGAYLFNHVRREYWRSKVDDLVGGCVRILKFSFYRKSF